MKIAIGCDHGGYVLKESIVDLLVLEQCEVVDVGCNSTASVDYPDFANAVCQAVLKGDADRGVLICGTGIGMSIAANRFNGIRATLCHEQFTAQMSREHNNSNVLCLGARVVGPGLALEIVRTWLHTQFGGDRHQRRLDKFAAGCQIS
nr:ribose 5-phosphate isomerase B [Desulfobulbaceae bacterium]